MSSDPRQRHRLESRETELRQARAVTPELISAVMGESCVCLAGVAPTAKARLGRLIVAGAWIDAALALLELELPQWKLRRIVYDDSEWFCSLAREPLLPAGFGDVVEASHAVLPLAVLLALVQAQHAAPTATTGAKSVPQVRPATAYTMCCDNFA